MKRIRLYIFLYFTATMLLSVAYVVLDRLARGQSSDWQVIVLEQATGFYGTAVLLPAIIWSARRHPPRLSLACLGLHLAVLMSFSIVHTLWNWGTRLLLSPVMGMGQYDYGRMPLRFLMELPADVITYVLWIGAYTVYRQWRRSKEVEIELVSARLDSLSRQLQPHFLFNALNAISSVMYEDVVRADRMLEGLGDYLRATLRLADSPQIPLSTELGLTRQYMEVMQARLEEKLHFCIRCDAGMGNTLVPPLLLQPLVENAFEHGQDPVSGRLHIDIQVERNGPLLRIAIRDHGPGPPLSPHGRGLANVQRRLQTIYGDHARMQLARHPQGGALVEVHLPA
ncbi:putative Histidine kinase internal region [Candidatus Sulfopaludibacter sp. SbA3]|nr:putative Histidine kinase internal region [Candidatus Sulfopaludibacter sp. SbA3]